MTTGQILQRSKTPGAYRGRRRPRQDGDDVVQSIWRAQKLAAQNTATDVPTTGSGRVATPKANEAFSVARMARPGGLCRTAVDPHPLCRARTSPIPAKGSIWNQRGGKLQLCGDITMAARATHSKTKRLPSPQSPSPQRKPIPTAKLARRLAEVQALRKLVQKAEASRAC